MIKKHYLLFVLAFILVLSGCSGEKPHIEITSPIEAYAPFMSSVPGFPLVVDVALKGEKPNSMTVLLETDNGMFLEWGEDMKVRDRGKSAEFIENEKIYWTPFDEEQGVTSSAKINVKVTLDFSHATVITQKSINIIQNEDGMYVLDNSE